MTNEQREMNGEHVLVVDDEPDILSILVYHLSRDGYRVSTAVSGDRALEAILNQTPDLVILDLMLPGLDGLEVLRALRANEKTAGTPVILLTAKGAEEERIHGFEIGADDYITKPFSPREVVLRARALLRRAQAESLAPSRKLRAGTIEVDQQAHLVSVNGREVDLAPLEFRLLETLLERRGRVQSRRQLLEAAWDTNAHIETRTVDMHVARLRSKLQEASGMIETVRGVGYRLRAD